MTMTMEDMLGKVADGWTVKAAYRTHTSDKITVEGVVRANEATQWFQFATPEDGAPLPLCQMVGRLPHFLLIEVVSVTPPPVYTNTPDTEYQIGDVVEAVPRYNDGAMERALQWSFHGDINGDGYAWHLVKGTWPDGPEKVEFKRSSLPEKLRLVGRVQPWPLRDSDDLFATAQRMIAKQIREIYRVDSADHDVWLDEAALVVERFDLDDAYQEGDPHDW